MIYFTVYPDLWPAYLAILALVVGVAILDLKAGVKHRRRRRLP